LYMYHGILESVSGLKLLKTGSSLIKYCISVTVDQLICQCLNVPVLF